jgi:hypothetical protein
VFPAAQASVFGFGSDLLIVAIRAAAGSPVMYAMGRPYSTVALPRINYCNRFYQE